MSTDTPHKGLRREPKAVTKPRVGNPWREALHGPVGVPVMRVRGGAPAGMPVPSWQADGSPREPRELPADGAPELPSIVRAYGDAAPVYVPGDWQRVSPDVEASRLYPAMRPAASPAESRALPSIDAAALAAAFEAYDTGEGKCAVLNRGTEVLWVDGDARAAHYRKASELARWEAAYVKALSNGHASWESIPVHPSIVAERTRALQSREAPSTVIVRALPASPMAHDPGHQTRAILVAVAPVKGHRYRVRNGLSPVLSALSALLPDRVDAREGVAGVSVNPRYRDATGAPCTWCDSIVCDRARDETLHCKMYDRAVSRGMPEALAYVAARDAFKGPRRAHRAAMEWIEDGRQATINSLRALDARGVDVDYRGGRLPIDALSSVRYRDAGVCSGAPIGHRIDQRNHRAYDTARVDGCHWRLVQWQTLQETLASASAGKVDAASAALSLVSNAAPRGVWWASELPRWRATRDAHNGAVGALVRALRATRDTTVYRVVSSQWEDTVKRVVRPSPDGAMARASSVVTAPREKIAPVKVPTPAPLNVAPLYGPFNRVDMRQWGERPEYPVAPRDRTTDNPSTVSPVAHDGRYYRDPSIEELSQRARRP